MTVVWEKMRDMNNTEGLLEAKSRAPGLTNPIFVVGVLRSGTSLLYSLLNQHPQMAFMYECDVLNFPKLLSGARFKGNWLARQEFYNQALSRHRLIYGKKLNGLENIRTPEDLYQVFGQGKDAALWGEKSPFYCLRLQQLATRNPGSPFVLIWRDPMEIYRSIRFAGKTARFFRRAGMLSRIIVYHEKMLAQAAALEKEGTRLYHVTYADLIDKTEDVCRGICEFLGVPFDSRMLDLGGADLSAVYYDSQHEHLRRGVIERQQISDEILNPKISRKLERFRNRWARLHSACFPGIKPAANASEPGFLERLRHQISGNLLCAWDGTKRVLFEFLPLEWLRTYRETARWFFAEREGVSEPAPSWGQQLAAHWPTILVSYLLIAAVGTLTALDPHLNYLPFYVIPCATLTLMLNWRWGSCAAVIASGIGPALLSKVETSFAQLWIFVWNSSMRFLLLQFMVLLLERIRREVLAGKADDSSASPDLHENLR
jgi:hypothetical protein